MLVYSKLFDIMHLYCPFCWFTYFIRPFQNLDIVTAFNLWYTVYVPKKGCRKTSISSADSRRKKVNAFLFFINQTSWSLYHKFWFLPHLYDHTFEFYYMYKRCSSGEPRLWIYPKMNLRKLLGTLWEKPEKRKYLSKRRCWKNWCQPFCTDPVWKWNHWYPWQFYSRIDLLLSIKNGRFRYSYSKIRWKS